MTAYDLPAPISTNALFFNLPRGGRAKTEKYKKWLHEAALSLVCQRARPALGQVRLTIRISEKSKCDLDNTLKCVLDALVLRGVLQNDSPEFVRAISLERSTEVQGVRVIIEPAGKASDDPAPRRKGKYVCTRHQLLAFTDPEGVE